MIRINLLSVEKPIAATASSRPKFSLNLAEKAGPIAALFVLAGCAGYIALDYLNLQQQDAALHQELVAARAEKARLQPILREVERFEAQKQRPAAAGQPDRGAAAEPGRAGAHARSDQPQHARIACGCST